MPHAWGEPRLIVVNVSALGTGAGAAYRGVAASPAVSVAVGPRPPQQYPTPLVVTAQVLRKKPVLTFANAPWGTAARRSIVSPTPEPPSPDRILPTPSPAP